MYTANTIVFTAGALVFMLMISPRLTVYAFLPLPVVSIVVQYFGRRIHERFERIQAMFSDISARPRKIFPAPASFAPMCRKMLRLPASKPRTTNTSPAA